MTDAKQMSKKCLTAMIKADRLHAIGYDEGAYNHILDEIRDSTFSPSEKKILDALKLFYLGLHKVRATPLNTTKDMQKSLTHLNQSILEGIQHINKSVEVFDGIMVTELNLDLMEGIKVLLSKARSLNKDIRAKNKLDEIEKKLNKISISIQSNKDFDNNTLLYILFVLFYRCHASTELALLRQNFEHRMFEYHCQEYTNDENKYEIVKATIENLFSSLRSFPSNEVAEIIYTLGIFVTKLIESEERLYARYLNIFALIQRGQTFLINKKFEKAFNDLAAIKNLHGLPMPELRHAVVNFLIGEIYYHMYNYQRALAYYQRAHACYENIKTSKELDSLRRSYRPIQTHLQYSRICWRLGKFRESIIAALRALRNLLNAQPQKVPEKTIENIDSAIADIEDSIEISERIDKNKIAESIIKIEPCEIVKYITEFPLFASMVMLSLGYNFLTLRLDDLKKRPYCTWAPSNVLKYQPDFVFHWLFSAYQLDPGYGTAHYDLELYFLNPKHQDIKDLRSELLDKQSPRDTFYKNSLERTLALEVVKNLRDGINLENRLLVDMVKDIDRFVSIPREIFNYLSRDKNEQNIDMFVCLRRWSSFTPCVPRPRIFKTKGGGYFLRWKGRGIVIDPGFDFLTNLYDVGFSLSDIDAIVVTHDHIDHVEDLLPIINLNFERIKHLHRSEDKHAKKIQLVMNQGSLQDYGRYISTLEGTSSHKCVEKIYTISPKSTLDFLEDYSIKILGFPADHQGEDNIGEHSTGIKLELYEQQDSTSPLFRIGITSDTKLYEGLENKYADCDILVAHLGPLHFAELAPNQIFKNNKIWQTEDFKEYTLKARNLLLYLGYRNLDKTNLKESILKHTYVPKQHLHFNGTKILWKHFKESAQCQKLFLISEFHEESEPFRHRIAHYLNEESDKCKALTCDIGLIIALTKEENKKNLLIQCSKCAQDNSLTFIDTFHPPDQIKELSIKKDEIAMIYLCKEHDSKHPSEDPNIRTEFIESFERFSIFD